MPSSSWLGLQRWANQGEVLSCTGMPEAALGLSFVPLPLCLVSVLPDLLQSFSNLMTGAGASPTSSVDVVEKKRIKISLNSELSTLVREHWAQAVGERGLFGVQPAAKGMPAVSRGGGAVWNLCLTRPGGKEVLVWPGKLLEAHVGLSQFVMLMAVTGCGTFRLYTSAARHQHLVLAPFQLGESNILDGIFSPVFSYLKICHTSAFPSEPVERNMKVSCPIPEDSRVG